jgi:hypothetical protein
MALRHLNILWRKMQIETYLCIVSQPCVFILFFCNPILFANCTGTFNKLCNVTEGCRGALSSTPPYLTGSRPRVSVGNKTYKLHLKD